MIDEGYQMLATEVIGASLWYSANLYLKFYVSVIISPKFT